LRQHAAGDQNVNFKPHWTCRASLATVRMAKLADAMAPLGFS
jgi:hypothetical protein